LIIQYQTTPPSKNDYFALFATTGWNDVYHASPEELARAIANSNYVVCAFDQEQLVGFGRVVTDGVLHAMIYEMIVDPGYQGLGIGTHILEMLVRWCKEANILEIQLFCARDKRSFYEKNGFVARPDDAPGMQYRLSRDR
jgi:GNAT superfamily N-acetyltransferase